MLAQIVVHTDAHPYHIQLISFWLSLAPVAVILALILFVQLWRIHRNRRKHGPPHH
jgi:predicted membrane metal-binding protein